MKPKDVKFSHSVSSVVGKFVKLTRRGKDFVGCCPFHSETTASLLVQDERKTWHCFGCGKHGDVIDFVQEANGCTFQEACSIITGDSPIRKCAESVAATHGIYDRLKIIDICEQDLPKPNAWLNVWNQKPNEAHPDGRFARYKIQTVHPYRNKDHVAIGCTVRIILKDKKIVPMLRMIEHEGERVWAHCTFPNPRPMYRRETIGYTDTDVVLVVEGEKCADAASLALHTTAISWAGGANAAKFTDFSDLAGRNVLLWPDADAQGYEAMMGKSDPVTGRRIGGVIQMAYSAGVRRVKCLGWDKEMPKGWDVADAVADGWDRARIIKWMKQRINDQDQP